MKKPRFPSQTLLFIDSDGCILDSYSHYWPNIMSQLHARLKNSTGRDPEIETPVTYRKLERAFPEEKNSLLEHIIEIDTPEARLAAIEAGKLALFEDSIPALQLLRNHGFYMVLTTDGLEAPVRATMEELKLLDLDKARAALQFLDQAAGKAPLDRAGHFAVQGAVVELQRVIEENAVLRGQFEAY